MGSCERKHGHSGEENQGYRGAIMLLQEIEFWIRQSEWKRLIEEIDRQNMLFRTSSSSKSGLTALMRRAISSLGSAWFSRHRGSKPTIASLQRIRAFEGLSAKQLEQIARLSEGLEVPPGQRLVTSGDVGKEFFIIAEGQAIVRTVQGRRISLGPGEFFGEMSLIDGEPRSATVEAATLMHLLVIGDREFWQLLSLAPHLAREIMSTLSRRVREAEGVGSA